MWSLRGHEREGKVLDPITSGSRIRTASSSKLASPPEFLSEKCLWKHIVHNFVCVVVTADYSNINKTLKQEFFNFKFSQSHYYIVSTHYILSEHHNSNRIFAVLDNLFGEYTSVVLMNRNKVKHLWQRRK